MAKLVGLILMLVGIYLGVVLYTEGSDAVLGGDGAAAESAEFVDAALEDEPTTPDRRERSASSPPRAPITARVRDRVQSTMDERARRIAGSE